MINDTAVFDAMRHDPNSEDNECAGRMGTREAIMRDGLVLDPASLAYCPREWINPEGYVDIDLVRRAPRLFPL